MIGKVGASKLQALDTPHRRSFLQVFLTLWHESAGEQGSNATEITSSISVGPFGERIHSKIRRFVVVREGELSCTAL